MFNLISYILIGILPFSLSVRYHMYPTNMFQPCPPPFAASSNNAKAYAEIENIELLEVDDTTIEINGNLTFIRSFGSGPIGLSVLTQYHSRGFWKDLPYRLESNNFCMRYLGRKEIWYNVIKHFKGHQRRCPPKLGVPLTFDHTPITLILEDFGEHLKEGDYRAIVNFFHHFPEGPEKVCFLFNAEIKPEYSSD